MNSQNKEAITALETLITEEKAYWEGYFSNKAKVAGEKVDTWYQCH